LDRNYAVFVIFDEMTSSGLCESDKSDYIKRMIKSSGANCTTDKYCFILSFGVN